MLDNVNFYYEDGAVDIITRDPETDHVRWQTWVYFSDFMCELGKLAQPMDTAPRDGTWMLIFDGEKWVMGTWWGCWGKDWVTDFNRIASPVCWLPLPGKPEGV